MFKTDCLKLVFLVSSLILTTPMRLLCLGYSSSVLPMCWWFFHLELMWHHKYQACDTFIQTALKQPKFGVDIRGCSSSSLQLQLSICGVNADRSKTTFASPATQLKNLTYQQKTEWEGYKVSELVSWIIETSTTHTVYHFYHSRKKLLPQHIITT